MNSIGFLLVILCIYIIPAVVGGAFMVFLVLWAKGKPIGKNMAITSITLFLWAMILCSVYEYLGIIDTFSLDNFIYFSWAAAGTFILALIFFGVFTAKNTIFIHVINMMVFTAIVSLCIPPSIDQIKMTLSDRERANSIAKFNLDEFTPQQLPEFDHLFKHKSQQEQYDIYLTAIYNKSLPKELYQYFVQQLGSPLKDEHGSFDYAANYSGYYNIPFFKAIAQNNVTALQVFIAAIQASSAEERKQAQNIIYAAPADWIGLESTFNRPISIFRDKPTQPGDVLKQAELLLSAFPGLANTKEGVAIIDSTIQNADVRAMKLFARYSHPSTTTLTLASYVLAGEKDKIVNALKKQPSLLHQQITIGQYYSGDSDLLSYIIRFGNKEIVQAVIPIIDWQAPALYYNGENSFILAYAADRVKGVLFNASLDTNKSAVDIFTLLLNTQLRENPTISIEQLWDIATDDFHFDSGFDSGEKFDVQAIQSICHSTVGPQFLRYVDDQDKNTKNETVKSEVAGIKGACQ